MDPSRYARLEDEQRFLAPAVPASDGAPWLIEDRYVRGTRLRLRVVTAEGSRTFKLGHKVRLDDAAPGAVWHTTCYLDEAEFATLAGLPADTLAKRRWPLPGGGRADEFLGSLGGLVLLEGDRPMLAPRGAVEVTFEERYCGASLAGLDDLGAAALLVDAGTRMR